MVHSSNNVLTFLLPARVAASPHLLFVEATGYEMTYGYQQSVVFTSLGSGFFPLISRTRGNLRRTPIPPMREVSLVIGANESTNSVIDLDLTIEGSFISVGRWAQPKGT